MPTRFTRLDARRHVIYNGQVGGSIYEFRPIPVWREYGAGISFIIVIRIEDIFNFADNHMDCPALAGLNGIRAHIHRET